MSVLTHDQQIGRPAELQQSRGRPAKLNDALDGQVGVSSPVAVEQLLETVLLDLPSRPQGRIGEGAVGPFRQIPAVNRHDRQATTFGFGNREGQGMALCRAVTDGDHHTVDRYVA